jgi:hypothetical protein
MVGGRSDAALLHPSSRRLEYLPLEESSWRMSMRRFTRLTNGFSKKFENLQHAVALNFVYYNFCRIHTTLRVTPAMAVGLATHVWELEELVALLK